MTKTKTRTEPECAATGAAPITNVPLPSELTTDSAPALRYGAALGVLPDATLSVIMVLEEAGGEVGR
jgi:hypothetical protein